MMLPPHLGSWALLSAVCVCVACGGSVSGTGDGGGDASPGGDANNGDVVSGDTILTSLDDTCDGVADLNGASIVAAVSGVAFGGTFTTQGASVTSPITIRFDYTNGAIVCHHAFTCSCGAPDMPARIDLHVDVTLKTDDGTFDEVFAGVITKSGPLGPTPPNVLHFSGAEPIASLGGTYQPVITGTWDTHDVAFDGDLTAADADAGTTDAGATDGGGADGGGGLLGATTGSAVEQVQKQLDSGIGMGQVQIAGSWQ